MRVASHACGCLLLTAAFAMGSEPLHQRVDQALESGIELPIAGQASDAEIVRRVSIDLLGVGPTAADAKKYVADQDPNKYTKLVDRLLADRLHARRLADHLDISLMERRGQQHVEIAKWREYLFESCLSNKPYDALMRELLTTDGEDPNRRAPARFLLDRGADPDLLARDVGRMFFGKDLQCAQCHDHPNVSDYAQADYYGLKAFFTRTTLYTTPKTNVIVLMEAAEGNPDYISVFEPATGSTAHLRLPDGQTVTEPKPPAGQEYKVKPAKEVRHIPTISRRKLLADSLAGNKAFQLNAANRIWAFVFGRGNVHPVDLMHSDNPPTNSAALEAVANELVAKKFDMRAIIRELVLTKAYRRSIDLPVASIENLKKAKDSIEKLRARETELGNQTSATELAISDLTKNTRAADKVVAAKKKLLEAEQGKAKPARDALAGAENAVRQAQTDRDARKAAMASVEQARQQSEAALAKLPNDPALTQVVNQLKARAEQLKKDVEAAGPRITQLEAAVPPARKKLAEFDPAINAAQTAVDAAAKVVVDLRNQRAAAVAKLAKEREEFRQVERAVGRWDAWREWAIADQAIQERRKLLSAIETEAAPTYSLLASLDRDLSAAEQAAAAVAEWVKNTPKENSAAAQAAREREQQLQFAMQIAAEAKKHREQATSLIAGIERKKQPIVAEIESTEKTAQSSRIDFADRLANANVVAPMKPLTAEEFGWTILQATGVLEAYRKSAPTEIVKERKAAAEKVAAEETKKTGKPVKPADVAAPTEVDIENWVYSKLYPTVGAFIGLFASGNGQPQAEFFATVDQALFVANGGSVESWVAPGNATVAAAAKSKTAKELAEELFWAILNRPPTQEDVADVARMMAKRPKEIPAVARDIAWSLIASAEFRFNH